MYDQQPVFGLVLSLQSRKWVRSRRRGAEQRRALSRKKFWRRYKTIAVFCAQHILHSVWSKHRIVKMADDRDKATDQMKTWKANRGSQVCICIGLYQVILLRGGYHSWKWVKGRPGVTG